MPLTPYINRVIHGDCLEVMRGMPKGSYDVIVSDPPYGIHYCSNSEHRPGSFDREIPGDEDTYYRDSMMEISNDVPMILFGSWKSPRPRQTKMLLVWDTLGALGMGDLSIPWKPSHQEIYVIGRGFVGPRTSDVLSFPPVQSMACNGRVHPHEKPVSLMLELIKKCPLGIILDPFCGSGTTLVAAKMLGRRYIGIDIEKRYCDIAEERLRNTTPPLPFKTEKQEQGCLL